MPRSVFNLDNTQNSIIDLNNCNNFNIDDFRKLCENQIYLENNQPKKSKSYKKVLKHTVNIQKKIRKLENKISKLKYKL